MLTRLIEHLLVHGYNGARNGLSGRKVGPPAPVESVPPTPPGHVVIGHVLGQEPDGDVIAHDLLKHGIVALTPEARRRHLYILGATGTGKTNLLLRLIESDIKNKRAFCVVDLRGDLVDRVLLRIAASADQEYANADQALAAWSKRLLLLDLRHGEQVVGFNPLLGAGNASGEGESYSRALHLLEVLRQQSDSWGVQLEETLRNSLLALSAAGWSLLEIEPLLSNPAFRAQVLYSVSDSHVNGFFERFEKLSSSNQTTWALSVLNKVTPLLSVPSLRLTFGSRQTVDIGHLLDTEPGMAILVSLAVDRLHHAAHLAGGLFVSAFQSAIMARVDQAESERVPSHLYVDEFEMMASERFQEIVAEGRRFGVGLCLSHQNLSQLTPNLRNVLRNNVHTQIYFQTGSIDAAELAKEITPTQSEAKSEKAGGGQDGKKDKAGKSHKNHGGDETPVDVRHVLMSQGVGEAYLIRRSKPSLRIRTLHCPDPAIDDALLNAIRRASYAVYGRPRAEMERELKEREAQIKALDKKASKNTPVAPVYEIRHGKTANFKPRAADSDGPPP
jgi:hypothetical protein